MIRLTRPTLGASELDAVRRVLASGHLVQGPTVAAFEVALSERLGVPHVVACSTGTTAIQLALLGLGLKAGDEVIVPDFVFPSVAAAVLMTGAMPVVCDIDPDTFNMNPALVQAAVTEYTQAVVAVHQFGVPCDALAIADATLLPVIEDAACALGARDRGGLCGTQTGLGCFSFHPRKIITTGEGGAVAVHDKGIADRLRHLRQHGMRPGPQGGMEFPEFGVAGRMSDLHAAIGLAQLERLDEIIAGRARAAALYRGLLTLDDRVLTGPSTWHPGRVYQGMVVRLADEYDRDVVVAGLRALGVESTIGTYSISSHPGLLKAIEVVKGGVPGSKLAARQSLTLPLWPEMTEGDVDSVVAALAQTLPEARRLGVG